MRSLCVTLAPGLETVRALGAESGRDLLDPGSGLWGEAYAATLASDPESTHLRVPLPGTPLLGLARVGRPAGSGTGWVRLRRYARAGWRARLAARLSAPRSDSLAAREWNLLCHLRRFGVTTPEPLALVAEEHPFCAARSALVTRELASFRPARAWLEHVRDPRERARALAAAGRALARAVLAARVVLPRLDLDALEVALPDEPHGPGDACGASGPGLPGLALRRRSELAIVDVRGARIARRASPAALAALLARLERELGSRSGPAAPLLSPRERARVAHHALASLPRARRRALWARLARSHARCAGA